MIARRRFRFSAAMWMCIVRERPTKRGRFVPASREIRITLSLLDTVMRLILTAPFTALGIILLTLASNLNLGEWSGIGE